MQVDVEDTVLVKYRLMSHPHGRNKNKSGMSLYKSTQKCMEMQTKLVYFGAKKIKTHAVFRKTLSINFLKASHMFQGKPERQDKNYHRLTQRLLLGTRSGTNGSPGAVLEVVSSSTTTIMEFTPGLQKKDSYSCTLSYQENFTKKLQGVILMLARAVPVAASREGFRCNNQGIIWGACIPCQSAWI